MAVGDDFRGSDVHTQHGEVTIDVTSSLDAYLYL